MLIKRALEEEKERERDRRERRKDVLGKKSKGGKLTVALKLYIPGVSDRGQG